MTAKTHTDEALESKCKNTQQGPNLGNHQTLSLQIPQPVSIVNPASNKRKRNNTSTTSGFSKSVGHSFPIDESKENSVASELDLGCDDYSSANFSTSILMESIGAHSDVRWTSLSRVQKRDSMKCWLTGHAAGYKSDLQLVLGTAENCARRSSSCRTDTTNIHVGGWNVDKAIRVCVAQNNCLHCTNNTTQKAHHKYMDDLCADYVRYLDHSWLLNKTNLNTDTLVAPFDIGHICRAIKHSETDSAFCVCPLKLLTAVNKLVLNMCRCDYALAMSIDSTITHHIKQKLPDSSEQSEKINNDIDDFWFQRFKSRHAALLVYIYSELAPARILYHYKLTLHEFYRVCSAILAAFQVSRSCVGENVGGIAVASHFEQLTQSLLKTKHLPSGSNVTMYNPNDYMVMLKLQMTKIPTTVTMTVKPIEEWPASIQRQFSRFVSKSGNDPHPSNPNKWIRNMIWTNWCKIPGQLFFSAAFVTKYSAQTSSMSASNAANGRPTRFVVIPIENSRPIDYGVTQPTHRRSGSISHDEEMRSEWGGTSCPIKVALDICLCLIVDQGKCMRSQIQPRELVSWLVAFLHSKSEGYTSAILDTTTNELYIYFRPCIECGAARVLPLQLTSTEQQHFEVSLYNMGKTAVESCSAVGPCNKVWFGEVKEPDNSTKLTATFVFHSGSLQPHIFLALLSCPVLDIASLRCNNPLLIEQTLGICAAHQTLKMEVTCCMNYLNPDIRDEHANIIVSWMTQTGKLRSITHKGLSGSSPGELQDCCFEQNAKSLNQSALNGISSKLQNSSSRLLVGKMLSPYMEMEHTTLPRT